MKLFIDFDGVLFDSYVFLRDLLKKLNTLGVDEVSFLSAYGANYSPYRHIKTLFPKDERTKEALALLESHFKDAPNYLFSDALPFLKNFRKEDVFIVSYGDSDFQMKKITSSGVLSFCSEARISQIKSDTILEILNGRGEGEKIYFIDDRLSNLEDVSKNVPGIKVLLLDRLRENVHEKIPYDRGENLMELSGFFA